MSRKMLDPLPLAGGARTRVFASRGWDVRVAVFPPPTPPASGRGAVIALLLALLLPACADEGFGRVKTVAATLPPPPQAAPAAITGSLYNPATFTGLATDRRARRVGDLISIRLVERTSARKSSTADASRDGGLSLSPPSFVGIAKQSATSNQSFKGSGTAAQDNLLSGEISVTVARVLPGGILAVAGEKRLTLNRGEEQIQVSGLIRAEDIAADNSVASTKVADAHIRYSGTGQVADQSKQGWLARFFAKVSPL